MSSVFFRSLTASVFACMLCISSAYSWHVSGWMGNTDPAHHDAPFGPFNMVICGDVEANPYFANPFLPEGGGGGYSIPNDLTGYITITPTKPGWSFSPVSMQFHPISRDWGGYDACWWGTENGQGYVVNGYAKSVTGTAISNVTITLSGSSTRTLTTDQYGFFQFTDVGPGDYTLTPAIDGYVFDPVSVDYTALNQSKSAMLRGTVGQSNVTSKPVFSPTTTGFINNFNATITCATSGSSIYYTTNGSTPTQSSTQYTQPVAITQTTTIKAIAYAPGKDPSTVATIVYTKLVLRDPENPASTTTGLNYSYYETTAELTACTDMLSLTPASTGTFTSFDNSWVTRAEYYAIAYEGYINITTAGIYTFYTNSDDGSQLFIGNTAVVTNEGSHPMEETSGEIGLNVGKHAIKVLYWQGYGGLGLEVYMSSDAMSKQIIPASLLFKSSGTSAAIRLSRNHLNGILNINSAGRGELTVAINRQGSYRCALVKTDGKVLAIKTGSGAEKLSFTEKLSPGMYLVRLTADNFSSVKTCVVR